MSTHYIRAPGQNFVVNVPMKTARDARLSYRARGILQRLLSNAEGFSMSAVALTREGIEGRDAIRTALGELENAGYITRHHIKNEAGRFSGTEAYVYNTRQADDGEPENPLAENPTAEKPTLKSSKSNRKQKKQQQQRQERAAAAISKKASAQVKCWVPRESGIECWYPTDPAAADKVEAECTPAEITAAVAATRAAGKSPAPGTVMVEIQHQRQEKAREAGEAARHTAAGAAPESREEAARKSAAAMAELAALQAAP